MMIIFLIEWFYNHPSLRYGGYCLIVIIFFFPASILLAKYDNSLNEKKSKFIFLIALIFVIFFARNIVRINDEIDKYSFKPLSETFYKVESEHLRIDKKFNNLINNFVSCKNNSNECDIDLKPKMSEFLNNRYNFIYKKN